jgi:hypothetical protein
MNAIVLCFLVASGPKILGHERSGVERRCQ